MASECSAACPYEPLVPSLRPLLVRAYASDPPSYSLDIEQTLSAMNILTASGSLWIFNDQGS